MPGCTAIQDFGEWSKLGWSIYDVTHTENFREWSTTIQLHKHATDTLMRFRQHRATKPLYIKVWHRARNYQHEILLRDTGLKWQSTFNFSFLCFCRRSLCNSLWHPKHLRNPWKTEVLSTKCTTTAERPKPKTNSVQLTFWIVFLKQVLCSSMEAWMNSSMWSFRSSMKVASSVFFFRHDAIAGFLGTDGAGASVWPLLEAILTLDQEQ